MSLWTGPVGTRAVLPVGHYRSTAGLSSSTATGGLITARTDASLSGTVRLLEPALERVTSSMC